MSGRAKLRALSRAAVALLAVAVLGGCAAKLAPAPGAAVVPGRGAGAIGHDAGVQIIAYVEAWTASPATLPTIVTPVLVVIDNGGTVPLRVRHEDFALAAAGGARFLARSPYEIDGFASVPATGPVVLAYPRFSFSLGIGGSRGRGRRPFYYADPFLYDDLYYPISVQVPLPTPDMVQMALPERLLEGGARVTGFLYFDRVKRDAGRVDFTARLVRAADGAQIGTVTIPFVTE